MDRSESSNNYIPISRANAFRPTGMMGEVETHRSRLKSINKLDERCVCYDECMGK